MADFKFDITKIEQQSDKFDTIICYHILEHIENDKKAMCELYRVLKPNGTIYIQTPFKDGNVYENNSITSPEDRLKYFGQEDHLRIYSVKGLKERLEASGFNVEIKTFKNNDSEDIFYGFNSPEKVLIVSK